MKREAWKINVLGFFWGGKRKIPVKIPMLPKMSASFFPLVLMTRQSFPSPVKSRKICKWKPGPKQAGLIILTIKPAKLDTFFKPKTKKWIHVQDTQKIDAEPKSHH